MHFVYSLLVALQLLSAIFLIYIITIQESKNDGLQGQIGTTATTSFKGKAGREEQLTFLTRNAAIAFFVISILTAIGAAKHW